MGDISVDFFLETLKELTTSSKLDSIIEEKHQLQSLEEEIKYLRGFLKVTEKKRNEHSEVMKLVMEIRDVVSEAENIVEQFVIDAFKAGHLSLDLEAMFQTEPESVQKEIKTLTAKVKQFYDENTCDLDGLAVKKFKHSSTRSGGGLDSSRGSHTSKLVKEKVVVGFDDEVKTLLEKLDDRGDGRPLEIITIIGAGGGGKTTLAREVFDHPLTSHIFEIRAWVDVSQDYDKTTMKRDMLIKVLKSALPKYQENYKKSTKDVLEENQEDHEKSGEDILGDYEKSSEDILGENQDHEKSGEDILGDYEKSSENILGENQDHEKSGENILGENQDHEKSGEDILGDYEKSSEDILRENQEDHGKSIEDILGEKVHKCLKGRKYLIVMDDIWGLEAWNDMQRSCPNECKGSKVLFTSRQLVQPENICYVPHFLAALPKHQSWELLKTKVFGMKCFPSKLVDIGKKIAEKCEGLPLAIVAIGGILAKEDKTLDVWKEVAKNLSSIIAKKQEAGCMEILELSYNHLPLHLKACFLYIGAFLEDSDIRVRELLWLWIAEGFIQQSEGGKSLEAIAKDHLIDLVDRSLVMVARKSSLGGIKSCRIHDLLRIFCLKKAMEENFLVQIYEDDSSSPSTTNKHRRLFIADKFFHKFSSRPRARNLHSFLCLHWPNSSHLLFEPNLSLVVKFFNRLRVLSCISDECQGEIGIGHLVHLRYLALRTPRQEQLFSWPLFSNLLNLETLDLQFSNFSGFIQLPCDIFNMVKLRHLYSKDGVFQYHCSSEEAARIGFDHSSKLDSLQTLHRICACKHCLRLLVRTPNLRKLGLEGRTMSDPFILPNLDFLKYIESLSLTLITLTPGLKLSLTVKRLTLRSTFLKWEELSILQNLSSLEVLKFIGCFCDGPVWNTSEEGFPQLKYLSFKSMSIEQWNASEDEFPKLEVLVIENCKQLERIPFDFAHINELREIKLFKCSKSVEESARKIQEEQKNKRGDDDCLNLIATANYFTWNSNKREFAVPNDYSFFT